MNENIRILRPFLRGLPIIILAMVISVLMAKKYLSYVTPMYESTAKLKLADIQEGVPSANLFKDFDVFATANKIATEVEVLKSENLLEKTIAQLPFNKEIYRKGSLLSVELFQNSPIQIKSFLSAEGYDKRYQLNVLSDKHFMFYYPSAKKGIAGSFGKPLVIKGGTILITLNQPFIQSKKELKIIDNYEFEFLSKQKILDKVVKNLDIVPVDKDVPVIRINYKSNVPEKAALLVNKLAETYIREYIENKFKAADTTVDFLKEEIDSSRRRLSDSENNIQQYRDQNNIINIQQETETDLRKIAELKIQQTNIKMNLDAVKKLNGYISNGKKSFLDLAPNFEAFNDLLSTEMVKGIKKLQAEKKDLLLTYTPENEKVKIIDQKINDLIDYQVESVKNTEKNLEVKYNEISNTITDSEKVFVGLPEKEKQLEILNREFNLYENNYNFLNTKRIEAEIARSAKISFHKIITPGVASKTPVSPVRSIIIIVAAVLGMLGSIVLIYIVHMIKAKVNDVYTIEKNSTIPIAIATPFIRNKEKKETVFLQEALQLDLKGLLTDKGCIVISSYNRSEEHLFHSINLFQAFQKQGRKVLFIDATGDAQPQLRTEDYVNLSDPKYTRYTQKASRIEIEEMMKSYDLSVLHNQSIQDGSMTLSFMSLATQNLIILDSRKTAERIITEIELLKDEFHLPNMWFVLNRAGYNPSVWTEIKKLLNRYLKNHK
ncbi:GumC family protein [Pedobacter helvus]|uniref:GumC family protein n=1 Tax=Pedobacter helvus TaxID=2563444 RepID=A0ABW9JL69_9SPHI|nr:Wzz/FepE/Etk N-terminal domain-containing protein [Pedobacter ureilyticus]